MRRRCAAGDRGGGAAREDPGALRVLRAYERWRKSEVAADEPRPSMPSTAASRTAPDRWRALAQRGLGLVDRSQELRRFFIGRALGMSGELPRAAR